MKAITLNADDELQLVDVDDSMPGPGEVLIDNSFAGVQWGDVLVRQGHFPTQRPYVPGFEATGHIVAVGPDVDPSRIGEAVTAMTSGGAFAERVVSDAQLAIPVGGVTLRAAAGFGWVTPTAYDLIYTVGAVHAGDRVLIHAAAGGVGTRAVQFARAAGAGEIVGIVGTPTQREYATHFGYDQVIDKDSFPAGLDNTEYDLILDPIGGPTRAHNLTLLSPHGRLVVFGNIASWETHEASTNDLLMRGQSLMTYNSNLLSQTHPSRLAASARAALSHVAAGRVIIDATDEYALADAGKALDQLAAGRTLGKSILRITA